MLPRLYINRRFGIFYKCTEDDLGKTRKTVDSNVKETYNLDDNIVLIIESGSRHSQLFVRKSFRRKARQRMSKRETYEERTETLLLPIVERFEVEIYDVEYVKEGADYYLRAYIDKAGGVTIQDCENVSRALSEALDKEDFIPDAYILEVSSPGLGRTLKKDKHLEKSLGQEVEIKLFKPIEKCKEFAGTLKAFDQNSITILENDTERTFGRSDIALIRLALDF